MIAWATLADIGTAAGTLVLAGATFVSVPAWPCCTAASSRASRRVTSRTTPAARRGTCGAIRRPSRGHSRHSTRGRITVDVLYGDHEGRQPSVTRFVLLPEADSWRCDATRYWSLPPS